MGNRVAVVCAVAAIGLTRPSAAVTVDDLDPAVEWRVRSVHIDGEKVFSERQLKAEILTRKRPWYIPWRGRPPFDPGTFTSDLERLKRFYEQRGYYGTKIGYDLEVGQNNELEVRFHVEESQPVVVDSVDVGVRDGTHPLPEELPLRSGDVFAEAKYEEGEQALREFFLERGYAHVDVERQATVDLDRRLAFPKYTVKPGPEASFGEVRVDGTEKVAPHILLREIEWNPGERFSLEKIKFTRENLLGLELFRSVRIGWEKTATPEVTPMIIDVKEGPPRELRFGVGYGTEDQFRAQLRWAHHNWLGDGRRLSFDLKYSAITSSGTAKFVQPHFLWRWTDGVLEARQEQANEDTYLLYASRLKPRIEHRFWRALHGVLGYDLGFLKFNDIADETEAALGGVRKEGFVSGPTVGLVWNTADNPLNPKSGEVVSLFADETGAFVGGDYRFYKLGLEGKKYWQLFFQTVFAARLKLGLADTVRSEKDIPLSERFYAGGEKSVRGYGRRRLGPKSAADDPIGGLSLTEGSLELRRAIWEALGGSVFLDFGQVRRDAFDLPVDDLEFSAGPGISYDTPVGPLRLDIGFPFKPPAGDPSFRVHFSIGQFF